MAVSIRTASVSLVCRLLFFLSFFLLSRPFSFFLAISPLTLVPNPLVVLVIALPTPDYILVNDAGSSN